MKTRTTVLLLVVVVAVAAYIRFYERDRPNTEEANRRAGKVVTFERNNIDGIVIQNGDDKIELRKKDNKWRIEAPIKDQADSSVADLLLSDLEDWQKFDTIGAKDLANDKKKLDEFGLLRPKLRLKLLGKDAPPEISIGNDAAFEGKVYVGLAKSKDVLLASKSVRDDAAKKPEEFRDKRLTDLTTGQINRFVLKTGHGEMELQKQGENWEIMRPLRARADDRKVADILAQVTTTRVQQFVSEDQGDLQRFGLGDPRGLVTLFSTESQDGQALSIGSPDEKNKEQVYVRYSARGSICTVPKKIEEILNATPADLRDRHLVRFDSNMLDRITIEAPGKAKTVLARKGEAWTIANRNDQPANADEVRRLVDALKNEQVTRFIEDVASDLPKYGLDKPQLQITLSSFASENTAETKAGERPFATINFGRVEGGDVYCRLGEEPFIVAVQRSFLDKVFSDPLQWQEVAIFKFKPEQIHRLSVVSDREISLTRGGNNEWVWVVGSGPINQANVQSLVNTLSNLRAVRWVGATTAAHAFDKPQLAVTFTTSPDDKETHKLLVGATAGGGMWFARTDNREGTFVLSGPDFNAFKLPLGSSPSSFATPMATATPSP